MISFAKTFGYGLLAATSINAYVNAEEECLFGENCGTLLYNAELGGAGPSKWKVGVSKTGNFSQLLSKNPLTLPTGSIEKSNNDNNEFIDSPTSVDNPNSIVQNPSGFS